MKTFQFDAVVIGTGCAGYNCADTLYDEGVTNIAIVTEGINRGTSRNTGSDKQTYYKLSLSGDAGDSMIQMASTLFEGGAMDGDVALTEAANSARAFLKLVGLGVPFPTNEYGEYVGYKTDHDPCCRATSIGPYTSKKMTEVLQASVERKGIPVLDKLQVVKILTEEGKAVGLIAWDLQNYEFVAIQSPAVVLATGGPANVYFDSVFPAGHTGSSSLALLAGAQMRNLAEWQYGLASTDFRWNVSGTYQQVLPRYISVDKDGVEREFLLPYFQNAKQMLQNVFLKGYEWPFDVRKIFGSSYIDLLVYQETAALGRDVYMDFTREPSGLENGFDGLDETTYTYLKNSDALLPLPIERLKRMNPGAISLYADHGIDITKSPLKIAVCAQHNNGGVSVDSDWRSTVKGLYVVGEAAGTLGIFRPGGSALNSCQVGSLRAAQAIAYGEKTQHCCNFDAIASQAEQELLAFVQASRGEKSNLNATLTKYQKRMSTSFAFLRRLDEMQAGEQAIMADLQSFADDNKWTKQEEIGKLFKNYDALTMSAAVAKCMIATAQQYGSRGSGMVTEDNDFLKRVVKPENTEGREKIVTLRKEGWQIDIVDRKPIPKRELWFEKAWANFRARREK